MGISMTPDQIVAQMMRNDRFSQWLGIEVLAVHEGYSRVRMKVREEMVNGFGVAHGGITFSLADSALAFASNAPGAVSVSIDAAMSFPEKVSVGDVLTAECAEESRKRAVGFYTVRVTNQADLLVAVLRGTVYRTQNEHSIRE